MLYNLGWHDGISIIIYSKILHFQIKLLEEEIAELEALEEVHEQLVESNHELELDLREELDMAQAAKREVGRFFFH